MRISIISKFIKVVMNINVISEKKRFDWPAMAALSLTFLLLSGSFFSARAAQQAGQLVSSGSQWFLGADVRQFGIVGQSSPPGTAVNPVGTRLLSGPLLMYSGIAALSEADSDGDGTPDAMDAFPADPAEDTDTDGDGIGNVADPDDDGDGIDDNSDAFPLDPTESADTDGDGVGNNADAFPLDPTESVDTDGDGVGDNSDAFPFDPDETKDSDGDGIGDNSDASPFDPDESADADGDGVGDNNDAFPLDPNESADTDGDGVGDNGDAFPFDPTETTDTDGDGIGDNSDPFPDDPDQDSDDDGIDDVEENNGPNNGDGNGDGVPDSRQANVASFISFNGAGYVTLASPAGTFLTGCRPSGNPSAADGPAGISFPLAFWGFAINGFGAGGTTTLTIHFPDGLTIDDYYQYGPTSEDPAAGWYKFLSDGLTGAVIDPVNRTVTLYFVDGGRGDDNAVLDGSITAFGGTGARDAAPGKGGGGSGGCFIDLLCQ